MGRGTTLAPGPGTRPPGLAATTRRPPLPAAPYLVVGLDRRRAIARALAAARPGDLVEIRGRGPVVNAAAAARGGFVRLDDRAARELA